MSLSDCPKCWDTLCSCGYQYQSLPIERVREIYNAVKAVLEAKEAGIIFEQERQAKKPGSYGAMLVVNREDIINEDL